MSGKNWPVYQFRPKFLEARRFNTALDAHFKEHFHVEKVSDKWAQKMGFDRIFKGKEHGVQYSVEYKADSVAARTGNAFIECKMTNVDKSERRGWFPLLLSQLIAYYVPPLGVCYLINAAKLKDHIRKHWDDYEERKITNQSKCGGKYYGHGILVPLREVELLCEKVIQITHGLEKEIQIQ